MNLSKGWRLSGFALRFPKPNEFVTTMNLPLRGEIVCLFVERHPIEPCKHLKILGSMISSDGSEKEAFLHRVQQSWRTYFLWKRVLESNADIASKLLIWKATVMRSMQWALETTRQTQENSESLNIAQRSMFRKMLKRKRRPLAIASDNQPALIES